MFVTISNRSTTRLLVFFLGLLSAQTEAFHVGKAPAIKTTKCNASPNKIDDVEEVSRRSLLQSMFASSAVIAFSSAIFSPRAAYAAERASLESALYTILRVREATAQETRLIKSGKFKDVQRANVKLAVKFMVENYRLGDAFNTASAYLDSNSRQVSAAGVGQNVVQNLYTILEYFDASDVQNIKVGQTDITGKEAIVLKGLDSARKGIDEFLTYFPEDKVNPVKSQIAEENELNFKEFDSSLGDLVNVAPPS